MMKGKSVMAITVKDINEKVFTKQVRGYSIEEVDDFLDELAEQMEVLIRENRSLMQQVEEAKENTVKVVEAPVVAQPAPVVIAQPAQSVQPMLADEPQYFKNLETTLRETLLNAQRIADETVAEARQKANDMIAAAEEQAAAIASNANADVEAIRVEAAELRKAADEYRASFLRLVEDQVSVLKADSTLFE